MYCRTLLLQRKPKLGCTKPLTGPHRGLRPWIEHRWLRIRPMCLAVAGVANQSETKSHSSYCVIANKHIMNIIDGHIGVARHNPFRPLKFLENIVIFCFEKRFSKQNSAIRIKSNILPPNFFAPPKLLGWPNPLDGHT